MKINFILFWYTTKLYYLYTIEINNTPKQNKMATLKLKEFNQKAVQLRQAKNIVRRWEDSIRIGENTTSSDYFGEVCLLIIDTLEAWFDALKTVAVSAYIGSRKYYKEVVKIGKSYYNQREKMTKGGGGWNSITEIAEITEEMTNEMISDSHYY